jgi:putative DNA primase/helicase
MTGGDRLTGRFMRQDFFEFEPTFKLLVAGNHLGLELVPASSG